jgi:cytidylate kinase
MNLLMKPTGGEDVTQLQIVAIDGPAASGKTTLGKCLAQHLDYLFFDTGVMYRALTWQALKINLPVEDESRITALALDTPIDVRPASKADGRLYDVWVQGEDVTWKIREPQVDANVSIVSAYPGVRKALSAQQRRIGLRGKVVMVGRDIGTVVLPEADLKIYLDASLEQRALRRYKEVQARNIDVTLKSIKNAMADRDRIDTNREVAPLRPADDAIIIDSDSMNMDQVFAYVKKLLPERLYE